jgi:hypothetical protein
MFLTVLADPSGADQASSILMALGVILLCFTAYFAPALIARKKSTFASVLALNFFLGWTLVGWVVALAWALKAEPQPTQVIFQQPVLPSSTLCSGCGKYSAEGSHFCSHCGRSFVEPPALAIKGGA